LSSGMKRGGNTGDQKCRWEREPPPGISSKVILVISGRAARCTQALSPSRREQSVLRGQCLRHRTALLTTLCQHPYWLELNIQGNARVGATRRTDQVDRRNLCESRSFGSQRDGQRRPMAPRWRGRVSTRGFGGVAGQILRYIACPCSPWATAHCGNRPTRRPVSHAVPEESSA